MKQRFRRLDPGLLVALAICLLAIWPFVSRSSLPTATDAELHVFRLAELGRLFRAGEAFPRWAPNFYYGYGYPIFNFYAPLAYYLGLVPELLPLWDAVAAVKIVFVLGILLGGVGMYGFCARNWGRIPALVATAAYVYAPFIVFVDPHARGDLAEAISFGIFPLAMWAMDRLRTRPQAGSWLLAVVFIALLVVSHNLMALVFTAILAGWCLWSYLLSAVPRMAHTGDRSAIERLLHLRLFMALAVGIGVAAFFWLPVALEQDAVNLGSLIGEGDNFDFRSHFLSPLELLSPARIMDWSATEPDYVFGLGVAQLVVAVIGAVAVLTGRVRRRRQAMFFGIVAAATIFLMMPVSQFIWESIPYLPFLQFPWRLLGPTAFCLAVLVAAGSAFLIAVVPQRARRWSAALLVGAIMLGALPLIQVAPWPVDFGPTTALRVVKEELTGRWLGTTSTSDFVPATVDKVPGPEGSLLEDFTAERPLDRVNRNTLPDGTSVRSEEIAPLHFRYEVESESKFPLRLFLFDFPGWVVSVDSEVVQRELGRPEGFIVVPMSAGEHVVEVEFVDTSERKLSYLVSAISALLAIGYAAVLRSRGDELSVDVDDVPEYQQGGARELAAITLVAILIAAVNALLVEPQGWLRHESPAFTAVPAKVDQFAQLDGQIALIGYDVPDSANADSTISFTAYWQAMRPLEENYQVFVHLLDEEGNLVTQSDALNPGDFPTENWPADKYVRDRHAVVLPPDLAPGAYRWSVGMWLVEEGTRLPVRDASENVVGDSIILDSPLILE